VFNKWRKEKKVKNSTINQTVLDDFIIQMNMKLHYSDNTKKLCLAALKFKLNKCEYRGLEFPESRKKAK
jgi:hypothetical protein